MEERDGRYMGRSSDFLGIWWKRRQYEIFSGSITWSYWIIWVWNCNFGIGNT
jgi:hypothetical protein